MYKHIMIPTDGSHLSEEAAEAAIHLARGIGARVTVIHVVPEPAPAGIDAWTHADQQFQAHLKKVLDGRGSAYLENVCDMARRAGVTCECALSHGEAPHAEIIVEARDRGCDLIVMASHGRKGHDGLLLASETIKVMTLGATPVLVHHSKARRAAALKAQAAAAAAAG